MMCVNDVLQSNGDAGTLGCVGVDENGGLKGEYKYGGGDVWDSNATLGRL